MEKLLLRPAEVAEILGMGRSKVYELLASGALPCIKIGKSVRVPVDTLRQWVATQAAENESIAEKEVLQPGRTVNHSGHSHPYPR